MSDEKREIRETDDTKLTTVRARVTVAEHDAMLRKAQLACRSISSQIVYDVLWHKCEGGKGGKK